jgi:hypothetical protein
MNQKIDHENKKCSSSGDFNFHNWNCFNCYGYDDFFPAAKMKIQVQ